MLGHQLVRQLGERHEVAITLRLDRMAYQQHARSLTAGKMYPLVDVRHRARVQEVLADFRPDATINAVGIVKQRNEAHASVPSLEINALFPHLLAEDCATLGSRVVHMSTDCVFSGGRGDYVEDDESDARDLYGRTKFLGELHSEHCITLRTSIIGLELSRKTGLVEWFLAQSGSIKGYGKAIYTGFTTMEMGRIIEQVLTNHPELSGLWHVASTPINKFALLTLLAEKLERSDITIERDDNFVCDRSLRGDRFESATGYRAASWDNMLEELSAMIQSRHEYIS
jgi:dTDP-4-dehydrorhamnose reductase